VRTAPGSAIPDRPYVNGPLTGWPRPKMEVSTPAEPSLAMTGGRYCPGQLSALRPPARCLMEP